MNQQNPTQNPVDSSAESLQSLAQISTGALASMDDVAGASLSIPMPFQTSITLIEDMRVAGTPHIPNIDEVVADLSEGCALRFERDPNNLNDVWAIRIYAGAKHIGYVPADVNEILARMMDGGKALSGKLTTKEKLGSWHRLYVEVNLDD